ncbi:type II secretion protein F [Zhaonella formicivorans]|uniref:type II secretion protein F n=1 Tax=Zhaonella formicivorans TaxID=2528593 RepID=UPI0010E097F6|nr:type II secretion protein F [Zhaonella formicivorans]
MLILPVSVLITVALILVVEEIRIYRLARRLGIKGFLGHVDSYIRTRPKLNVNAIEQKIKKAGTPFNMTPAAYYMAKVLLPVCFTFYAFFTGQGLYVLVLLMAAGFFLPDALLFSKIRDRREMFRKEFPETLDIIELGITADVPLEDIFLLAADAAEGAELKKELLMLSARYFVTKNKEECLQHFTESVDIPEAKILSMALLQGEKTGRTREILSSVSSGMFNAVQAKAGRGEKSVEYKILFAVVALMASSVMLYMQVYFSNLESGLKILF